MLWKSRIDEIEQQIKQYQIDLNNSNDKLHSISPKKSRKSKIIESNDNQKEIIEFNQAKKIQRKLMKSFQKSSDNIIPETISMSKNHTIKSKNIGKKDKEKEEEMKMKNSEIFNSNKKKINNNEDKIGKDINNENDDFPPSNELSPTDEPSSEPIENNTTIPNSSNDIKKNKITTPPPNLSIFRGGVVSKFS